MKRMMLLGCALVMAVVGCDTEEDETVGAFTSSLSAEEATVENLTFGQQDTFCSEIVSYSSAKMNSMESQYGCMGSIAAGADSVTEEATDPCADIDYTACNVTVADVEACAGEYGEFSYLTTVAALSALGEAAPAAAEGEEMSMEIDLSSVAPSCEAPTPTPLSAECAAIAANCSQLFPAGSAMPVTEGGEHEGEEHAHEGEEHAHEGEEHEGEDHEGEDHEGEDHEGEEGEM